MKKILVAALLLTAPSFAFAQKGQKTGERRIPMTAEQRAEKQTQRLSSVVNLSPDQRQKIYAENLRTAQAMQPHLDNIRSEKKAMREIGKRRNEAYSSILTPDQMATLKAKHKERRQARGMNGGRVLHRGKMEMQSSPAPKE